MFNRIAQVEISIKDKIKKYSFFNGEGIHISFNIELTQDSMGDNGTIDLYGLPLEDINYLATQMQVKDNKRETYKNYVKLFLGYEDEFTQAVFDGGIFEATPQLEGANLGISLTCNAGMTSSLRGFYFKFNKKGEYSISDLVQEMATLTNSAINKSQSQLCDIVKISNPLYNCSIKEALRLINKINERVRVFWSCGVFYIQDDSMPIMTNKIISLNKNSGLIGTPKPTMSGASFSCLINPLLRAGSFVKLESKKLKELNGIYWLTRVNFNGDTYGSNWYAECEGINYYQDNKDILQIETKRNEV